MKPTTTKLAVALAFGLMARVADAATPLVDVHWIKAHSCDDNVRVLDVRSKVDGGSKAAYLKGHIPCAVYTDYAAAGWRAKVNNVPGMLSPVPKLEKLIGSLGIDNNTHVVIYHAGNKAVDMGSATRVYWTFKTLGHDEVSILDGGFKAYQGDPKKPKNPIEQRDNQPAAKSFKAKLRPEMIATKDDVAAGLGGQISLVDVRPNHQYLGISKSGKAKRAGTLPGAKNLPGHWVTMNDGGMARQKAELMQLYQAAAVPTEGDQLYFCNSGHWGSLGWFIGSEIMGNKQAKLYDGSMIEWTMDDSRPVEQKVKLK